MNWEELTGDEFPRAVSMADGVCLVPLSCIERHGHHLPLGTDMYIGRELCQRSAALEPAVVFPDVIFTQILEARHCPGTIAFDPDLTIRLLDNICREVSRNGLHKIVLVSAHGGNAHLLPYFAQTQLSRRRDYVVYVAQPPLAPEDDREVMSQWQTTVDGHAGESETSQMQVIRPDLIDWDNLQSDGEGMPQERLADLQQAGVYTAIWWYADHPTHYRGDGSAATAEKGERVLAARARALAAAVRTIKRDETAKQLQDQFHDGCHQPEMGPGGMNR